MSEHTCENKIYGPGYDTHFCGQPAAWRLRNAYTALQTFACQECADCATIRIGGGSSAELS